MGKRWVPLEANPDGMNQFIWGLGVPEDVGFCDVYGLDDEMIAMVPKPVLAVLLLYPQDRNKESQASTASSVETKARDHILIGFTNEPLTWTLPSVLHFLRRTKKWRMLILLLLLPVAQRPRME